MAQQNKTSCETIQLQKLLRDELSEPEESQVLVHLDECSHCRSSLQEIATGDIQLDDLRFHLSRDSTIETQDEGAKENSSLRLLREYLAPSDHPRMLGRLGNYEICGFIGRGSTGIVLKAFEPHLNRFVAIKVLSPAIADNATVRQRFEREGRAIAAVTAPHVVPVYAVSEFRGMPYIVMQYLNGGSLQQRIDRSGPLTTCEATRIGMQIARGLTAAHAQGIIHRDVKPGNILLENGVERALVTDFGLARVVDDVSMTTSGYVAGTPQYMSPEQAKGDCQGEPADLFSLGSTLYASVTGCPPFRAQTMFGVIKKVCESEPRLIRDVNPSIAPWMCSFITKLLSKSPKDRFGSAKEVASILESELAFMQSPSVSREPIREWHHSPHGRSNRIGILLLSLTALICIGLGIGSEMLATDKTAQQTQAVSSSPTDSPQLHTQVLTQEFDVKQGGKLFFRTDVGTVRVIAKDRPNCRLEVSRAVRAENREDAERWFDLHRSSFDFSKTNLTPGHDVVATMTWSIPNNSGTNGKKPVLQRELLATIFVPKEFDIDVETEDGNINLTNVVGSVHARSDKGNISLGSPVGDVDVYAGHGTIKSGDVRGAIDARTKTGQIQLGQVTGFAKLDTGVGDITIQYAKSGLSAFTEDGRVRVENVNGFADVETKTGDVFASFPTQPIQNSVFRSQRGDITLSFLKNIDAFVGGTTEFGTVTIPPLKQNKARKDGDPRIRIEAHCVIGSVKVETLNPPTSAKHRTIE